MLYGGRGREAGGSPKKGKFRRKRVDNIGRGLGRAAKLRAGGDRSSKKKAELGTMAGKRRRKGNSDIPSGAVWNACLGADVARGG